MSTEVLFLEGITLGQRVRIMRLLRRERQVDLARRAFVTQAEVSELERDVPITPAARARVLSTLGIDDPREPSP